MLLRASVTKAEWREFRKLALEAETSAEALLGDVIMEYLRRNGITVRTVEKVSA